MVIIVVNNVCDFINGKNSKKSVSPLQNISKKTLCFSCIASLFISQELPGNLDPSDFLPYLETSDLSDDLLSMFETV